MPQDFPISRCGSERRPGCGAAIIWTTNVTTGRRMPVDAEPDEAGTIVLVSGNDGPEARVLTRDEVARRPTTRGLYVSHFATCPNAGEFRGGAR